MKKFQLLAMLIVVFAFSCRCTKDQARQPDETYNPEILPANFTNSTTLSNTYFPFESGKKYIFEGQDEGGTERVEVQLLNETKTILGITCAVVNDKVWYNNKLVEDTDDWFAQDNNGAVWYMGEIVDNYDENGNLEDHDGSWEAGVDNAKPGIAMLAIPVVGVAYRQEYYFNEAEDEAEVVETGLTITVPYGTFTNCIKTKDVTALEPNVLEYKIYAPGIGLIREIDGKTNEVKLELIAIE